MRFTARASASVLSTAAPPASALPRWRANAGCGTAPAATAPTMVMASRRRRRRVNSLISGFTTRSLYAKHEQHVPRPPRDAAVSRVHEQQSAGDDRTGTIHAAAVRLDPVHGRELAVGVEL